MKGKIITIADVGINHNGDIDIAKRLIQVCSAAGVDFVKFQKRNPDVCVPDSEKSKVRDTPWGEMTYIDYKRKIEFGFLDYAQIDAVCRYAGIQWTASVWDSDSLEFMGQFDVPFIKIPSAHITNTALLQECAKSCVPVMLSTGMSDIGMVHRAVQTNGLSVSGVLHCVSTYPSTPEEQNMKCITTLQNEFPDIPIGFSNHHPGLTFLTAAASMGATILEFHVTLDRAMWGTDQAGSIEPDGVFKLMKRIKDLSLGMGDGIKRISEREIPIMKKLRG